MADIDWDEWESNRSPSLLCAQNPDWEMDQMIEDSHRTDFMDALNADNFREVEEMMKRRLSRRFLLEEWWKMRNPAKIRIYGQLIGLLGYYSRMENSLFEEGTIDHLKVLIDIGYPFEKSITVFEPDIHEESVLLYALNTDQTPVAQEIFRARPHLAEMEADGSFAAALILRNAPACFVSAVFARDVNVISSVDHYTVVRLVGNAYPNLAQRARDLMIAQLTEYARGENPQFERNNWKNYRCNVSLPPPNMPNREMLHAVRTNNRQKMEDTMLADRNYGKINLDHRFSNSENPGEHFTMLGYAVYHGLEMSVKRLLRHYADPNGAPLRCGPDDAHLRTNLHVAIAHGRFDIVKLLLDFGFTNSQDDEDRNVALCIEQENDPMALFFANRLN